MRAFLTATVAVTLAACSAGDDMSAANEGVAATHQAFSTGQFAAVYDQSAEELKSAISRDGFVKTFAPIYARTGPYVSGKTTGWKVNYGTDGNFIVLNHEAKFQHGTGQEEFVFRVRNGKAALAGYHVKTDILVSQ